MPIRSRRVAVLLFALIAFGRALPALAAQSAPPALAGEWRGSVESASGTMKVTLTIRFSGAKPGGTLTSPHGDWAVTAVDEKAGVWTVTFARKDGGTGTLTGKVADGKFTGDWNNAPMGVGSFELTKQPASAAG